MSRVLRRPMFRGGIADSDGVGITSGLMEPRQGYANGPTIEGVQPSFTQRIYDMFNPSTQTIVERLQATQQQPPVVEEGSVLQSIYDAINPSKETIVKRLQERQLAQREPIIKTQSYREEQRKIAKDIEDKEKADKLKREEEEKLKKTTAGTGTGAGVGAGKIEQPQESDTDVMNRYMEMFKSNLAGDKDELKSQRYFELAKFGLNLLSQPGGLPGGKRDLLGAVGRAGVPAIEGLSRISAEEKAAERQAKILGFQAALRELENPALKKIQTLSKLTGVPVSEIAKKELAESAQASNVKQNIIERYASVLQSKDPESNLKIAEEIVGMGKNLTQFQKHKDPNILTGKEKKDQYYYFENPGPSGELVGKWDGKKFLVPGDEGF
jgi:hypothetical protein